MIRITRETDLGVLLLAAVPDSEASVSRSARELAEHVGISVPMAGKILKGLARAELISSQRGAKGGYVRSRSLDAISMADVVAALDGPIGLVDCVSNPGSCDQETGCPTRISWKRLNQVIEDAMKSVPISEMICEDTDSTPALIQLESGA